MMQGYKLSPAARAAEARWGKQARVMPAALVRERRIVSEIPGIERPGANILQVFGLDGVQLPPVGTESALTVPAFCSGVTFLSRSLATLPLHAFRKGTDGNQRIMGGLETLIHEAPNPEWTSFKLRQYFWQQVFTGGRGLIWIERSGSNITGLYPVNPTRTSIRRDEMGRTTYEIAGKVFPAADVIDVPFMLRSCGVAHFGPVVLGAKAIQLAMAMNDYGATFFAGGGVPPLALVGPMPAGPDAMSRALEQTQRAIQTARESGKPIVNIPPGYELKPIGFDPEKGQMTDARRFQVEEIARVLQIPPTFLQDLTHGTMSNTEQEDLRLVKHLLSQWAQALEEEMNLKLFGQRNGGRFVEHNLDGMLRGDFLSRMQGLGQAVQNGLMTPDEARALENRPAMGGNAEKLFMQGATVPIDMVTAPGSQGTTDGI
jgi:HK97 family phage portal protein